MILISANAALKSQIDDFATTLRRAKKVGGPIDALAQEYLADSMIYIEAAQADAKVSTDASNDAADSLLVGLRRVHLAVGRIYDECWNLLERPAENPWLKLAFPNATSTVTAARPSEQPLRLRHAARILRTRPHPRIDPARAAALATELEGLADDLQALVTARDDARNTQALDASVLKAQVQLGHHQLALLKKAMLADHLSEAEVHRIIPGHSASKGKPEPEDGAPPEEAPTDAPVDEPEACDPAAGDGDDRTG